MAIFKNKYLLEALKFSTRSVLPIRMAPFDAMTFSGLRREEEKNSPSALANWSD
jgi:hypothetical protein